MTVIVFIIVLAVLIFVHELGHFLFARWNGIRVDEFALGFGPKLFSKKIGETSYALNLIPFGGYVKIFGENPDDDSISGPDSNRSFVNKAKWRQISVLFAGVLFNFIFAWIIISISFLFGVLASVDSYPEYKNNMSDSHIIVNFISPGSPAEDAGIKAGDELIASSIEEIQKNINESQDKGFLIKYKRDGVVKEQTIIAEKGIVEGKYAIGIAMDNAGILKLPLHLALYEGGRLTIHLMKKTALGFYELLSGIFHGSSKILSSVAGPVGIAGLVGNATKLGFTYLLMFTAMISINLGILNLIPFPALDGGRIFFVIIEAIIRRPIKPVIANTINTIGFGLLLLLMVIVTYKDIVKLFVK